VVVRGGIDEVTEDFLGRPRKGGRPDADRLAVQLHQARFGRRDQVRDLRGDFVHGLPCGAWS
jgi:hypothetical protein